LQEKFGAVFLAHPVCDESVDETTDGGRLRNELGLDDGWLVV